MTKREIQKFVKDNMPKEGPTAIADLVDFQIRTLMADELNHAMQEHINPNLPKDRVSEDDAMAEMIDSATSPDDMIQLMRKNQYFSNQAALVRKALKMQDKLMPLIVDRYKKSKRDAFVENAIKMLAYSDAKYTRDLADSYNEIWLPYAQALACYLFGYHGFDDMVPLLISEYERFKRLYPNQTYETCPLTGLSYIAEKMEK